MSAAAPAGWNGRLGAGFLLASLCLPALGSTLPRVLSALVRPAFVAPVASLALAGLAAGGLVGLVPRRVRGDAAPRMGRASLCLSLALLGLCALLAWVSRSPLAACRFLAPLQGAPCGPGGAPILPLVALCLASSAPFACGGLVAAVAVSAYRESPGAVVACGLAGAGLGAAIGAAVVRAPVDPLTTLAALGLLSALAAWLFLRQDPGRAGTGTVTLALVALVLGAAGVAGGPADLKFVQGRYRPDLLPLRRDAVAAAALWPLPAGEGRRLEGVSRRWRGSLPEHYGLALRDGSGTVIVRHRHGDDLGWARASLSALPYLLHPEARALVVGAGGGADILVALAGGARAVRALEPDPLVMQAVQRDVGEISGRPYTLQRVEAVAEEGRGFLARDASAYDVIQIAAVRGLAGPAGPSASADRRATVEAFRQSLDRLGPGGVLAVTRFVAVDAHAVRLVATARAALEAGGIAEPASCCFVAGDGGLLTVLASRVPFTPGQVALLRARCGELGFTVLASPDGSEVNPIAALLGATEAAAGPPSLLGDAAAMEDDRPFLTGRLHPADVLRLGAAETADLEGPGLRALRALLWAPFVVIAFGAAWQLRNRGAGGGSWRTACASAGYFAATGLGFAVVGAVLPERFLPLPGSPAGAPALLLACFLGAASAGSARTRLGGRADLLRRRCARLAIVLLLVAVLLPALLEGLFAAPPWARWAAAVATAASLGYLMGQPVAAGVSLLRAEPAVPWAWGLGMVCVALGAAAAPVLAAGAGYTAATLVGPASCLVAGALAELVA